MLGVGSFGPHEMAQGLRYYVKTCVAIEWVLKVKPIEL